MASRRTSGNTDGADPVLNYHPVKGIKNHGNTCFFNAMLQAVNQTDELHDLYVMKPYERQYFILDKEYSVSVTQPNEVAGSLCHIFNLFTNSNGQYISAKSLLNRLGKKHFRFVRGTQEDSHEVLRALLDDIKTEEIENIKKEIRSQFDATNDGSCQDGEQNLALKGHLRMASKVDVAISKAVQGSVVSTVICHECHSKVENVEPFFYLSLPTVGKSSVGKQPANARDGGDSSKNSGVASIHGKRKSSSTEDSPTTKKQKMSFNFPSNTSCGYEPSQTIVSDKNEFQEHLRMNGYQHQYSHSVQKTTVQQYSTDLEHCLSVFTDLDVLDEDSKFICKSCSEKQQRNAHCSDFNSDETAYALCRVSKQLMIHHLPPVLILHIKRFEIGHYRVTKDSRYISFPEILDLAPYCTMKCVEERGDSNNQILYGLYAVVVHHGISLYGGHYVSYVKTRPSKSKGEDKDDNHSRTVYNKDYCNKGQWYSANDTYVHKCQFENVRENQAYMLFYELLPTVKMSPPANAQEPSFCDCDSDI